MFPKEFQARLQVPKDNHQAPIPLLLGRFVSTLFSSSFLQLDQENGVKLHNDLGTFPQEV
jgi:hypothetical protein